MIVLVCIVLIGLIAYKWVRCAVVCLICYIILPIETTYDLEMFFTTWAVCATIVCISWKFWLGFFVGFKLGNR